MTLVGLVDDAGRVERGHVTQRGRGGLHQGQREDGARALTEPQVEVDQRAQAESPQGVPVPRLRGPVTGDVAGTEAERFLEESGCRWLAKPFRLKDLLRAASELIA